MRELKFVRGIKQLGILKISKMTPKITLDGKKSRSLTKRKAFDQKTLFGLKLAVNSRIIESIIEQFNALRR